MTFQCHLNRYVQDINAARTSPSATAELSLHAPLKAFLDATTAASHPHITFTHEPRAARSIGRPDFVAREWLSPIGYVEAEAYGAELGALTGHAKTQNQRFIDNLDNFILTNFVEFRLYTDGTLRAGATSSDAAALESLLERFLSASPMPLATPEVLAKYLARRTRELQTQITTVLRDEQNEIAQMFSAFQKLLLSTLTPEDFADMYAQTLAYGLFAARIALPNATNFSRITAADALPRSNPFLRNLFYQVASPNLDNNLTWILDDIINLLRNVSSEMFHTAFEDYHQEEDSPTNTNVCIHLEDPVIHFYETFLAEYDAQRRVDRGVYYTPPQAIAYIVRSVDALLKTKLHKPDGLADDDALILEPAAGTGGFLLSVLSHIRQHITEAYGSGVWRQYVHGNLVQRLSGFEILVAPYTIAHLKLSLFLQANGWPQQDSDRLNIYLTNTLEEPVEKERFAFSGFISDEANAAVSVKRDASILAIVGNPPYPRNSATPSRDEKGNLTFIGRLIEDYKQIDGKPMGRENFQPLQADYVKFIRWGQWRIELSGQGVVGYIVNNSFLEGPIFRGMRQSLLKSFSEIYLLNLHGSTRKTEAVPDGKKDENVFNIQQGIAILLCVKEPDNVAETIVRYADLWGTREEKYRILSENDVQTTAWRELRPTSPLYLFAPQETERREEYEQGWALTDIFQVKSTGICTGRDKVTLHRTEGALRATINDFLHLSDTEVREKYRLSRDTSDWAVAAAQADLRAYPDMAQHITRMRYRPFDVRYTYYTGKSRGFHSSPRRAIMRHLRAGDNIALSTTRIITSPAWQHVLVTDCINDNSHISNRSSESGHVFPLYLYPDAAELALSTERSLNFKPAFLKALSERLGLSQTEPFGLPIGISPEDILGYLYAVLHSPVYRERYYAFLKYDFPRVPLTSDVPLFRKLAALGRALIDMHLGQNLPMTSHHHFEGEGDAVVAKYGHRDGKVWINQTQHFAGVPVGVWKFEIGAYQVCEKWLKERKGTALNYAEIREYQRVLVAVAETLRLVAEIEALPVV